MIEFFDITIAKRNQFDVTDGEQSKNALFFLTQGSFVYDLGTGKQTAKANDILYFPDKMRLTRSVTEKIVFYYIRFFSDNDFSFPPGKLYTKNMPRIISDFDILLKLHSSAELSNQQLKNHYLMDIFIQCDIDSKILHFSNNNDFLRIKNYMQENISNKLSLQEIADYANLSVSGLIYQFKNVIGRTPMDYFLDLKIEHAKRLLISNKYSISETADICGFQNQYYFSNIFKKRTGMSPTEYRQL